MNVTLIYPPVDALALYGRFCKDEPVLPPYGLAYIAAALEQSGHRVNIIDCPALGLDFPQLERHLALANPDIVGITANTPIYHAALRTVAVVKQLFPACKTVLGGHHPSAFPDDVAGHPGVDFVVIGEGEAVLTDLCARLADQGDPSSVPGLAFRESNRIVMTGRRDFIKDLDALSMPAFHLLPMHAYNIPHTFSEYPRRISLLAARGCPYRCYYCASPGFWRGSVRMHSPAYMVRMMNHLVGQYGIKSFQFRDDTFTANRLWVSEFCRCMQENPERFEWDCYTRVDCLTPELIREMKQAGCFQVSLGVESGVDEILHATKGFGKQDVRDALTMLETAGIRTRLFFLIGPPNKTRDDIQETLSFAKDLNPDLFVANIPMPYPGSSFYADAAQEGIAPNFEQKIFNVYRPEFEYKGFDRDFLVSQLLRAYKEFYVRPKYIFKQLVKVRFRTIGSYIKAAYSLLAPW